MQDAARCKHFEDCGLPVCQRVDDDLFCILHLPLGPGKITQKFDEALAEYRSEGRSDFRWVYFPVDSPSFQGQRFTKPADFRNATFSGMLNLGGALFEQELHLGGPAFGNVDLSSADVHGPLRVDGGVNNTFRLNNQTRLRDLVEIHIPTLIHIQANGAQFDGGLSIDALEVGSLDLRSANLQQGLTLRGRYQPSIAFDSATIHGDVDLRYSKFGGNLSLGEVVFDADSSLSLDGSRVRGDLILAGTSTLPREVGLDGAIIHGRVCIEAPLGAPRTRVVALNQHPTFRGSVTFTNVDLRDCLLVGNVIDHMEFSNIEWPRLRGRYVLRDEIMYRKTRAGIPSSNLREAYQVLKQRYQTRGDHVRAGDFHYGELEMKRRQNGFPNRWISWEFVYWMLSGYGVGHVRALFILLGLVFGFAGLYYSTSPAAFGNFSEALRYSLSVAALQRPEMPKTFSDLQKWLHIGEAILGPIQIGLFALALRMRLKR